MNNKKVFQKTKIVLCVIMFLAASSASAQYRINKTKYDRRTYSYQPGDRYNPTVTGIASFLVPGLGQMTAGEKGRGWAFLLSAVAPFTVYYIAAWDSNISGSKAFDVVDNIIPFYMMGIATWSSIDGVRVAKVNNLAWRDRNHSAYDLYLQPCITQLTQNDGNSIVAGIELKLTLAK